MKWARGTEQWASSKNSKLMRLFFFSIGRAFRAANWPWITLSRAENYAPRNDYNGSFKFSARPRFSMGGEGGAPTLFLPNPNPFRAEFATRPFFESFVNGNVIPVPFVRRKNLLTCAEWGLESGKRWSWLSFFFFFLFTKENVSNFR